MNLSKAILVLAGILGFSTTSFADTKLGDLQLCGSYSSQKTADLPAIDGYPGGMYSQEFKLCGLEKNKSYQLERTEFDSAAIPGAKSFSLTDRPERIVMPTADGCITGSRTIALFSDYPGFPVKLKDLSTGDETVYVVGAPESFSCR